MGVLDSVYRGCSDHGLTCGKLSCHRFKILQTRGQVWCKSENDGPDARRGKFIPDESTALTLSNPCLWMPIASLLHLGVHFRGPSPEDCPD